ncbi:MAG: FdtA/QdtA family cupin domain-containing protein [Bacteroidales bacterium]|jgi:dTDP-4-dehydrorhamnose 3,5-epimerase-like enzyme|nr:FdtA/QdtA family cupin domain-containing protein [Bacteroidales bacterium]
MARLIDLKTFTDSRGNLTVIEDALPFTIKRIFYIYGVDGSRRGGHRHHKTIQAAVCIKGRCKIRNNDGTVKEVFELRKPSQCLILEQRDWHEMFDFSKNAILMVLASEKFMESDYIFDEYDN